MQHYMLGQGLIFPSRRDELAFLHYIGKRNLPKASLLRLLSCAAWLLYLARTVKLASKDQDDRWRWSMAGSFMALMAALDFSVIIAARQLCEWYYWWHEHLKAGLAIASVCTFMQAGILLQSKDPPLFSGLMIVLLHAVKLTVDQVRLSTAVWLWALQLGGILLMSVGQIIEGTGGSEIPAALQLLLLLSILGMITFGVVLEARTRLQFCRVHEKPRSALGDFWESANVCLLQCNCAVQEGILKLGRVWRYPLKCC